MAKNKYPGIQIGTVHGDFISSQGQQGGTTSHQNNENKPGKPKKSFFKSVGFIITIAAAIVTILGYFGITGKFNSKIPLRDSLKKGTNPISIITKDTNKMPTNNVPFKQKHHKKMNQNKGEEKPIKIGDVSGDVVISQHQSGGITAHTVNITSDKYQEFNNEAKIKLIEDLKLLLNKYTTHPSFIINIESGNSMRNKVALEFESILTPLNAGIYPKGNTFTGTLPDHPVTIILNPINKQYTDEFLKCIRPFMISEYHFEYKESFDVNYVKFFINGQSTFDNNGQVTIN
jgi:hypothetical protein